MAIYRSDQAQLTFAVEAAPGGYPELASTVTDSIVGVPTAPASVGPDSNTSGVTTGTHYYKVTWLIDGVETSGGQTSAVITTTASHQSVPLTGIQVVANAGSATIHRKIYRTKANALARGPFYLVATLTNNNATGYADIRTDAQLTTIIPPTGLLNMANGVSAGSRSITVDSVYSSTAISMASGGFLVGGFIRIGPMWGTDLLLSEESEVRRILFLDGTTGLQLDTPLGFFHSDNTNVQVITAVTDTDTDKYMTFVPGVYETVEVPDPEMAIEPRYYLGTASKRNPYQFLKGQQTYTGSLGGMVLLDGRALRFPIGKVNTTTTFVNTGGGGNPTYGAMINQTAGTKKGDVYVTVDAALDGGVVVGTHLLFTGSTVAATTSTATSEIRKHIGATSATILQLNAPLQFAHVDNEHVYAITTTAGGTTVQTDATSPTTLIPYAHSIAETVDLDSMSWHLHVRDSSETDANDFDRRYHGGKVGNLSLSAEEGGLLTCGWDGVNFLGMNHNQSSHSGFTGDLPYYTLMQPIRNGNVSAPGTINSSATAEPYYFSQGQVKLFGSVIARVRSFSLSINNNEEPRYYLRRTMGRHRGPSEILEQRREYTCSVTLALPDATTNIDSAISIFKELLLEGDYGSGMQGFAIELRFDRGADDNIIISIPDDGAAGTGGNNQGAFINTAPHNITEANPMEVEAEVLFRNLKIEVNDTIAVYP